MCIIDIISIKYKKNPKFKLLRMDAHWIPYLPDGQHGYLPYWLAIVRADSSLLFHLTDRKLCLGLCYLRGQQRAGLLKHQIDFPSLFLPSPPCDRALHSHIRHLDTSFRHYPPLRCIQCLEPVNLSAYALDLCRSLFSLRYRVVGLWHSKMGCWLGRASAC